MAAWLHAAELVRVSPAGPARCSAEQTGGEDAFHQREEGLLTILFADDLAQQTAKQANGAAVFGMGFGLLVHGRGEIWPPSLAVSMQQRKPSVENEAQPPSAEKLGICSKISAHAVRITPCPPNISGARAAFFSFHKWP